MTDLLDLRYPLYLDVPMMVSFLAAIEDGVTYEENVHRRAGARRRIEAEVSGGLTLPSLLSVLPFDLRGRLTGGTDSEESEELQLVKRHTEASLFNRLRGALHDLGGVKLLSQDSRDEGTIVPGTIVEATGVVARNSLDELLTFVERFRPFIEQDTPSQLSNQSPRSQGNQQSRRGNRGSSGSSRPSVPQGPSGGDQQPSPLTIMTWVREDLDASDMTDIVLRVQHPEFPNCILTVSKDFGTGRTMDSLLGAEVTVLGKVSSVIESGEPVSLLRRSILGYMPREQRVEMFGSLASSPGFSGMASHLEVPPPLIQVIPLSIFV